MSRWATWPVPRPSTVTPQPSRTVLGRVDEVVSAPTIKAVRGVLRRFEVFRPSRTFRVTEVIAGGTTFPQSVDDTVAFQEVLTCETQRTLAETVTLTETFTRQAAKVILEAIVLTEALPRQINRPLTETVSLAENLIAIKGVFRDLADTVALTENLSKVVQKASGLAEAVELTEQLAKQTGRTVAETLGLTENLAAIKVAQKDVADVLSLSETVTRLTARVLEEQVNLTEAQQREVRRMLAETMGFTEQLVTQVIKTKELADTVSLTEAQSRQIGKAVQEVLGLTETRFVSLARTISEAVNLQEVLDVLFVPSTPALAQVGHRSPSRVLGFLTREVPAGFPSHTVVTGFDALGGPTG